MNGYKMHSDEKARACIMHIPYINARWYGTANDVFDIPEMSPRGGIGMHRAFSFHKT